jgi:catechol 2,3-dioxygenase-like lactoylglutathione lyase family enzyme
VHSLDHYALVAPDLATAADFYGAFGLETAAAGDQLELRVAGNSHCWGRVVEGARKKLHYISFGAWADDVPKFRERLDRLGVERLPAPKGFESNGIWFRDPDGLMLEIRAAEKTSPHAKAAFEGPSAGPNVRGAWPRKQTPVARPKRFSHMAIYSRDVARSADFYVRTLGLRLADRAADIIAFCHGVHGSDHHMVAFVKSDGPGLHHSSWDMGSIGGIGLGAMQMAGRGYERGWGLGRHVLGSNYFHYVRDPWGSFAEYTADMDYVPVDEDWSAGVHDAEDSFYLWANAPPDDFARNYEIE